MKEGFNVYRDDGGAALYDAMMGTPLEKEIFGTVVSEIAGVLKNSGRTKVLDLCCGTGILPAMLPHKESIDYTGADISPAFLEKARRRLAGAGNFKLVHQDALEYQSKAGGFDVAVLTSAYHHMPDERKSSLLIKTCGALNDDGKLVMYEKALRPYSTEKERVLSNEEFYRVRMEYLRNLGGAGGKAFDALQNVMELSAKAEDEYKVSHDYIMNDLHSCGFCVTKEIKVWPKGDLFGSDKIGDFVFVAGKY